MADENLSATRSTSSVKDATAAILGVLILVAFGVFIIYMLRHLTLDEAQWARALFLFGGVEAVAFAAAGYFFGTQVQRGKVEEARSEARAATQVADAAGQTAKSERRAAVVLATGIVANADSGEGLMNGPDSGSGALVAQARAILEGQ
jgi:hypothetical protein